MHKIRPAVAIACLLLCESETSSQTPVANRTPLPATSTDARPTGLPADTAVWIAWHDGSRVVGALEELTTRPEELRSAQEEIGLFFDNAPIGISPQ